MSELPGLIFTVCPGRCGTKYLASVLNQHHNICAEHELWEYKGLKHAREGKLNKVVKMWDKELLPHIQQVSKGKNYYVLTSHLINKGFLEGLDKMEIPYRLIHIRRIGREIALSLWRLNTIPGKGSNGLRYLISPSDFTSILKLPEIATNSFTDYQLCYWYAIETLHRMDRYKGTATFNFNFHDMDGHLFCTNSIVKDNLFMWIAGEYLTGIKESRDMDIYNKKSLSKRPVFLTDMDRQEQQVVDYVCAYKVYKQGGLDKDKTCTGINNN